MDFKPAIDRREAHRFWFHYRDRAGAYNRLAMRVRKTDDTLYYACEVT